MDVCIVKHIHTALYKIIQAYLYKRDFIRWCVRWCYAISISSIYIPSRMLHTILARVNTQVSFTSYSSMLLDCSHCIFAGGIAVHYSMLHNPKVCTWVSAHQSHWKHVHCACMLSLWGGELFTKCSICIMYKFGLLNYDTNRRYMTYLCRSVVYPNQSM